MDDESFRPKLADRITYRKHVGMWLLLCSVVCSVASRIASLFGYTGRYTLELVIGCIIISLVGGAFSYRQLQRKLAASPQKFDQVLRRLEKRAHKAEERVRSSQGLTKAQRLRLFFAYIGSAIVFRLLI